MKLSLKLYIILVAAAATISLIFLGQHYYLEADIVNIILFAFLILISHNASLFILSSTKIQTTIKLPIILPGIVILGPFWMVLITALFSLNYRFLKERFALHKFVFNRASLMLSVAACGVTYYFVQYSLIANTYVSFLIAALAYFLVNNFLFYFVLKISQAGEPRTIMRYIANLGRSVVTSYILAIIFFQGYKIFGSIFLPFSLIAIYILRDMYYSRLQKMNLSTQVVESFLKVIDAKDNYTQGHCERVANYTAKLCRACGFSHKETEKIVNMAKIHDIGKIYIEEDILKSSDSLTDEQFLEMQNHTTYGYNLLQDIDLFEEDLDVVKHHHERYDGAGYPGGLQGEEIPAGARIISICDAFDVMNTGRDYKPPLSKEQVLEEMWEGAGKQFDPEFAREMINLIEDGHFDDRFSASESRKSRVKSTRSRRVPLQESAT